MDRLFLMGRILPEAEYSTGAGQQQVPDPLQCVQQKKRGESSPLSATEWQRDQATGWTATASLSGLTSNRGPTDTWVGIGTGNE
jgi:hypothetical protein